MVLRQLTVRDYRNLAALDLEFPEPGVVILGENGQGKTNLLEAIYYLVLFRSFRGAMDRELVRFGEAGFFLAAEAGTRVTAGYDARTRRKKVTIAREEQRHLAAAVGQVTAVVFSPADRELVAGGPGGRRRYLDVVLALTVPGYLDALRAMRAAWKQRNAALRRGEADAAWAFDGPFAEAGSQVVAWRAQWAAAHAPRFTELSAALGERAPAGLAYRPNSTAIAEGLAASRDRDLRRGATTVGPHRDDVQLTLGEKDTRRYGSAGQQRTAAIALRLLEVDALRAARGMAPLALFDDVFAELDEDRQERLLALIAEHVPGQTILTAPRDGEIPAPLLDRPRWRMHGGTIAT